MEVKKTDNQIEFSVGELSLQLKKHIEKNFSHLRVRGEISGFTRAQSGHMYFSLKDDKAVLDAICWRGTALSLEPQDGLEIIATGKITSYIKRSRYQLVVEKIELAGVGAWLKLLEMRKKALEKEGLFAVERKKPLPFLPDCIGVVTSESGAVIHDILHRVEERFPSRILLWPVKVQGEGAEEEIAQAIEGFNRLSDKPDLLIIARGGGSLEDLKAFNEERVVRAIAASDIVIISAIGHETDTTLSDYAADLRVPTPTAAVERALPVKADIDTTLRKWGVQSSHSIIRHCAMHQKNLAHIHDNFQNLLTLFFEKKHHKMFQITTRLPFAARHFIENASLVFEKKVVSNIKIIQKSLDQQIEQKKQQVQQSHNDITHYVTAGLKHHRARHHQLSSLLESLSFDKIMQRGFAIIRDSSKKLVSSAQNITYHQNLTIHFGDKSHLDVKTIDEVAMKKTSQSDLFNAPS